LDIENNNLNGNIPSSIGNLSRVEELILWYNEINGSIPATIGNLSDLEVLWLDYNQLIGNIPSSMGNLTNLLYFTLSSNKLSGHIPSSLGKLSNLQILVLSDNHLSGSIPSQFGNLAAIYTMYLDNNQLSGSIPSELESLTALSSLMLSDNHFTFDGMELVAQKFPFAEYSPQATILAHQNSNTLSVSAGGTVSNNTYKWFKVGKTGNTTIPGDSVFHPLESGKYYAAVNNAICTQLTLHTDTVFYDATLPVTIINLKAQQQKSIVQGDWTSVTEINVTDYEIQRSCNALSFSSIGTLPAKGNGTQKVNYTFNDGQPLPGDNYYRIKAIDKDGKISYSNTVLVNMSNNRIITAVYPNPAKDILHVETNGAASFSLLNQSGKVLLTALNINGKGSINISGTPAGLYYLKNNNTGTVQKVVIVR